MSVVGSGGKAASFKVGRLALSPWTLGFIFVFIGGTYLRLRGLDYQSYWDDELFSAVVSNPHNSAAEVIDRMATDVHPPLFQLLLWAWFKIFGFSEWTGRLFPALFGVLALPVLYRLGCEVKDRAVGFGAAMLCSVNAFHLYYSQEMRSYSLLFFLGTLSLLYFVRVLDEPRRKHVIGWLLASVAMIYTHFFGVLAVAAEACALLLIVRQRRALLRTTIIAAVVFALAILPLIPLVARSADLSSFWIKAPSIDFAAEYFVEFFGSQVIAATIALSMLFGVARARDNQRSMLSMHLMLLWLAAIFLLPYIRSLIAIPMLTSRNTIIALPVVFVLAALGIAAIRDSLARGLLLFSLFAVSTLHILHQPPYYRTLTKPQIRMAAEALIAAKPDVDAVYADPDMLNNLNIYFAWLDAPFRARSLAEFRTLDISKLPQRFWLIDGRVGTPLSQPVVRDRRLRIVERKDFPGAGFVAMEQVQ